MKDSRLDVSMRFCRFTIAAIALLLCSTSSLSAEPAIGMVIMHGKGGSPTGSVEYLADALERRGYKVANLEMPWSRSREYDASPEDAKEQVKDAIAGLKGEGAEKIFVAGHSQGGTFALYLAGSLDVDGVICITPGGDVDSRYFREKLGKSIARARQLIAEGKGAEKTRLSDYEGKKGVTTIQTTPDLYLEWFDPDGAMSMARGVENANPSVPLFWIVAQKDYKGLRERNIPMFDKLPKNPLTEFYEPSTGHMNAPRASISEVIRWAEAVATSGG